jgi:hypothetical protein
MILTGPSASHYKQAITSPSPSPSPSTPILSSSSLSLIGGETGAISSQGSDIFKETSQVFSPSYSPYSTPPATSMNKKQTIIPVSRQILASSSNDPTTVSTCYSMNIQTDNIIRKPYSCNHSQTEKGNRAKLELNPNSFHQNWLMIFLNPSPGQKARQGKRRKMKRKYFGWGE